MTIPTLCLRRVSRFGAASPVNSFAIWVILLFALSAPTLAAGNAETFKARLSPLGVTMATVNTITGIGTVAATLDGTRLIIDVSFEGLTGAATLASIRCGPKGIPGPVVFDLAIPKASSGKFNAMIELTTEQVGDLKAGRLYLQIHSERAPDGSIRGWLLK